MTEHELKLEEKAYKEYLTSLLDIYHSTERRSKKVLGFIVVVCVVAVYFLFFDLLGGIWGYVLTVVFIAAGVCCIDILGILVKNGSMSDGKLAYRTCVAMEVLIEIKNGTYRKDGVHILTTDTGKYRDLYSRFVHFYPEYECKAL